MRSLDSSALIAVIRGELGADRVTRHLKGGLLSTANYAEVRARCYAMAARPRTPAP